MSTNEEYHSGDFHEVSFIDQNGELKTTKIPVVQELARQGLMTDHFPKRFIAFQPTTPENDPCLPVTPPVIDLAKLQGDATRESELRRLAEAVKEWGTFLIKNHGLEDMVLSDAKNVVRGFFGLSFEEKKANVGSYKSVDNMGYGKSFVKSEDQLLDWTDRLTMKAAPVDEATNGLMIWPKKPANFRQAIETYVEKSRKVLDGLLQDLAASLSLDENAFLQYFEPKQSEVKVRVNYYPPCPRPDLAIGIMPHSDASGLTLLLEFGATSGLQVLKDNLWTTLQWPEDNSLLVNIGDLVEIISNGVFKSPWHRVRTQLDVERFSLAYFYNPPAKSEIGPEVGGDSAEVTYKKVVVEDYVSNFYKISPRPSKEAMEYAKLT
ncbi:protein SRG1-like [Cynara cardunculus var. scolymus]|uniref:Isopenicillin N synthase n=1 Tax=Cynara cardunculus var. scolymus TaxID=59895 RepID=A0A118K6K7_CYNCS|nr:protein SRG1-like [Cynara cardunculus var. scolymus]KVI10847.1 Isopenicillin N synthase [Cynara cardunculus var. scolymus]